MLVMLLLLLQKNEVVYLLEPPVDGFYRIRTPRGIVGRLPKNILNVLREPWLVDFIIADVLE